MRRGTFHKNSFVSLEHYHSKPAKANWGSIQSAQREHHADHSLDAPQGQRSPPAVRRAGNRPTATPGEETPGTRKKKKGFHQLTVTVTLNLLTQCACKGTLSQRAYWQHVTRQTHTLTSPLILHLSIAKPIIPYPQPGSHSEMHVRGFLQHSCRTYEHGCPH